MALLARIARCQPFLGRSSIICRVASSATVTSAPAKVPMYQLEDKKQKEEFYQFQNETFWNKQYALGRPRSPFWIYEPQLTAILSITHRATGAIMMCSIAAFAVGMNVLPHDFMFYVDWVKQLELPWYVYYAGKATIAWPLMYHLGNGVRHLFWDMGYGFEMRNLYRSGYAVCLWSVVAAWGLAAIPVA